ncbi:MAG TPA: pyrroline-5-carboxylate reductase, partial [Solirubrobacterales bacterium]|nr:pyrroline-5-carboxylate reductase [Solirubrobacterales bacterium]
IGFAGAGNMAGAMARGWAGADGGPEAMLFCDLDTARAAALAAQVGGETRNSLPALAGDSDALVLAVKPGALDDVAGELRGRAPAVVSVLAGVPTDVLVEAFPDTPLLRVMPNQPVEVRRGVICHPPPRDMPEELATQLLDLLRLLGTVVEMDEADVDAAMAVMACSPAYLAMIAEALAEEGEHEGLDPQLSHDLVTGTLEGTAELLRLRKPHEIRSAVASPGGATERGLEALERGGLRLAIGRAVRASLERLR